jgi:RNA polymerase sigma factor (sigma-70 family)
MDKTDVQSLQLPPGERAVSLLWDGCRAELAGSPFSLEAPMNVHISYKVPKSPDIEHVFRQNIEKLQRRLQVFKPELVHLHAVLEQSSARQGFVVSLNLRLPSGQMAAREAANGAVPVIKSGFDHLFDEVSKHKDLLRNEQKWVRRRRVDRTIGPQVPFEQTLAAVHPPQATVEDISTWLNTNLPRLERYLERELRYRRNSGQWVPLDVTSAEVLDQLVAMALDDQHRPEALALEAWLFRLAQKAIVEVVRSAHEPADTVPLEASARRQNVNGSDEPHLQFHQPDERLTREDVIPNGGASPEQIAASDEMIDQIEAALKEASPMERNAFILFAIEGFTPEEIAAISDSKPEDVRAAVASARDRLRKSVASTTSSKFLNKLLEHSRIA